MNQHIFLCNELVSPEVQRSLRIPLEFISFAYIEAKMYKQLRSKNTFVLPNTKGITYGGIFYLRDYEFYIRILDAYHLCSMSTLRKNHAFDEQHRIDVSATPIRFRTVDEFERLMYLEYDAESVQAYIGNLNHPKINQRLNKTNSYRVMNNLDKHYKDLIREELL